MNTRVAVHGARANPELRVAPPAGHVVQFYEDDAILEQRVCEYLAAGLTADHPVIVIATAAHRQAFSDRLLASSIPILRHRASGKLTLLDAEETLASFMRDGSPNAELFGKTVGSLIRAVRARNQERPACAYGEMVDLLWKAGSRRAAIRLEQLWNDLARVESLSLMCGYGIDGFQAAQDFAAFQEVCACHAHAVVPSHSFAKQSSDEPALHDVGMLQQHARALAAELEHREVLEAELRQREEELRDFLENAVEGIHWVGPDGTILYANKAELELLGYTSSEYVGRSIRDFHADEPVIQDILKRLGSGQSISDYEARLRCKDGSTKHVLINSNVYFRDGKFVHTRCFTRDVTARRQAEERLHVLAEASAVLASSLDYDATLAAVAKLAVPRIADLAMVDMLANGELNRLASEHADPTRLELARSLPLPARVWETVRNGRSESLTELTPEVLAATFPADQARTVATSLGLKSLISAPLTARGRVLGAITLAFAESGRKYGDDDVRFVQQLAERASVAIENAVHYKAAEDASLAKDEFLAVVSHELRTPLNAILGWVHLLRENALPPEAQGRALETIERNGRAQNQLIEDLLDVSRIVSGKLRLDVGSVDLPLVVERAIDTVRPAADAKGVTILATLDPSATPVMGDADRLQQVAWNLLSNAVKFSSKGGSVRVLLRKLDSNFELLVQDGGQGIAPAFLPHVFERFRQADNRSNRVKGGLGLGLAIARNLVELHGGSIRAESEGVGHGALFAVHLPISPLRAASLERPPALQLMAVAPSVACPPELEGLDVLVVDDESDARELLAALLVRCKARPITASSVAEAIRLVREKRPDIVISDIGMPEEDGYALIKKLRRLGAAEGGQTPAVALTAYARTEERTKALVSGFSMHVPKPVEPSELLAVLASLAIGLKRSDSPGEIP